MLALQVAGHDTLLGRQEVALGVTEVANSPLGRVLRNQIGEYPADGAQAQLLHQLVDQLASRIVQ